MQHHFNFPTIYRELNYITTDVDKKFYVLQAMNFVLNAEDLTQRFSTLLVSIPISVPAGD
jgi:hypothetical protein